MVAETFSDRLNEALLRAGIPDDRSRRSRMAAMFQVSTESVRKWLEGDSIPDTKRLPEIAKTLGVFGEWLLTGQGPMHPADTVREPGGQYVATDEEELLDAYRQLDNSSRQLLSIFMDGLLVAQNARQNK